jgi:hypothetical protein
MIPMRWPKLPKNICDGRSTMKTILVHIEGDDGQEARLGAAFDLARGSSGLNDRKEQRQEHFVQIWMRKVASQESV